MQDINNKLADILELLKAISAKFYNANNKLDAINTKLDTVNNKLDTLINK